ncbi:hypothetical protein P171DRAFT_478685 [Karstenula rhodostoma CBS 690.94]|uniref:Uncharacterized protein n=1 Tax=Karstenula rhodostoma CBS 690.94 TaxID=1392251 RepID=A0A9P4PWS2_9PLEO|nr:hypothetical protein P171DRAFT_478685 [Karstenula rhodostoma CBS 690.94]
MEQGNTPLQQSSDGWNEVNGSRLPKSSTQDQNLENTGVAKYIETQITGSQEGDKVTASPLPSSDATNIAPKDIPVSSTTDKNSPTLTVGPVLSVGVPIGPTPAKCQKSKLKQARLPSNPKWYAQEKVYSDNTLYSKFGRSQMEAFLAGEGVDITEKFANATYPRYIERGKKRVKINKGQALVELVKVVHQRVIDRQKAGFAVGPNQVPHLGAEDWEAQVSAFDKENGPAATARSSGNLLEAGRKKKYAVKSNDDDPASVRGGAVLSARVPAVLVPLGPQPSKAISPPHIEWPDRIALQRLDQLRHDLKFIRSTIIAESEMGPKAFDNKENGVVVSHDLVNDKAAQQAQAKIAELDRLIRYSHGQVVLSVEVQRLVRRIIDAAIHFRDTERRFKAGDANKAMLLKEGRDANNEFQRARSDLMQRLAADILWDRSVQRGGYKVADIVLEVLPARPLEVLK